jgi:membrane protein
MVRAGINSTHNSAKDMAASIAYFSFLSLFPLILGLVSVAGFFLKSEEIREKLDVFISDVFPVGADFVTQNIDALIQYRGAAGAASIVILFWSAKKMVAAMRRSVNGALRQKRTIAFYLSPLRDYGMTLTVSLLMFTTVGLAPLVDIVADLDLGFDNAVWNAFGAFVAGHVAGLTVSILVFGAIYFLLPYRRPSWKAILPGLITAAVMIEIGKGLFVFYVDNVSNLEAVYGSVSSIIVVLLWMYFNARVLIYGAEVIHVCQESRNAAPEPANRIRDSTQEVIQE